MAPKGTRHSDVLADEAREAAEAGLPVFITVLHSLTTTGVFGGPNVGSLPVRLEWAKRVAAIEAEGWRLEQWAVDHDAKGNPNAYPVFRRAPQDH
jgi:hypothetical protein